MKATKDYINLLPKEERRPAVRGGKGMLLVLLFVLAWGAALGWQWKQVQDLDGQMASLAWKKRALLQEADALYKDLGITVPAGTGQDKSALVNTLMNERVLWSEVFRQFSHIVPKGMWFDNVEGTAGDRPEIKVKGGALSYLSISEFMLALEKSGFFLSPQLLYAQKTAAQGQDVIGFEIACGIKKGQGAR